MKISQSKNNCSILEENISLIWEQNSSLLLRDSVKVFRSQARKAGWEQIVEDRNPCRWRKYLCLMCFRYTWVVLCCCFSSTRIYCILVPSNGSFSLGPRFNLLPAPVVSYYLNVLFEKLLTWVYLWHSVLSLLLMAGHPEHILFLCNLVQTFRECEKNTVSFYS